MPLEQHGQDGQEGQLGLSAGPGAPLHSAGSPRIAVLRWSAAGSFVLLLAWLSFTRNGWVPFLSGVDLGVHEFGHLLFMWAPALWMSLAGSGLQVAAPAALAGYFWWRRDRLAFVLLVAWTGMSLNNVSVYMHDATRMVLPLFGDDGSGAGHDWHNILRTLGWLEHTDTIAWLVRLLAVLAFAGALGCAVWFARSDLYPPSPDDGPDGPDGPEGRSEAEASTEWSHLPRRMR